MHAHTPNAVENPPRDFPADFVFGADTAAYQVEGQTRAHGKGKVAWDDFLAEQGRFSPDPASDFYNRYDADLALAERFGLGAVRLSIAWSRIFPQGKGEINAEGVQFYHDLFASCRAHGVEPFVTLHHFDTPLALYAAGDWLNPATVDAFENYARFCFAEYAGEVERWFTFNEISANAQNKYIEGTWPMAVRGRIDQCIQSQHNMMYAHARAVLAFKEGGYPGTIGVVHSLEYKYPLDARSFADVAAAENDDLIQNRIQLDATFRGDYAPATLATAKRLAAASGGVFEPAEEELALMREAARSNDCLGINYYQSRWLRAYSGATELAHNGTGEKGSERWRLAGVGERVLPEGVPATDWDWAIWPEGLYDLLVSIKHDYPNYGQVFVTENGTGLKDRLEDGVVDDQARIDYVEAHLRWTLAAMRAGVNVGGYFMWSLQDQFSWTNGYNKRYGLFYVDFETQERTPKASAYWYRRLARTGRL